LGKNCTGKSGTGNNGTDNNGTSGKVGKNSTLMLNFPSPQTQTPNLKPQTQTPNANLNPHSKLQTSHLKP